MYSLCSRYESFTILSLILSHLELLRIELPKLTQSILMEVVQRFDFLKSLFLSQMHLHIVLQSLLSYFRRLQRRQQNLIFQSHSLFLYSFNPFFGINGTGKYLSGNNVSNHRKQPPLANFTSKDERIKQKAIYFNFRLDIGVYIFKHVNEFASIFKLMQSRKINIPINSKGIKERFSFSLFDTSVM